MTRSVQYGVPLEKVTFQFSTADFVYMLLFGMASLLVRQSRLQYPLASPL